MQRIVGKALVVVGAAAVTAILGNATAAQTPQPFPRPGAQPARPAPAPSPAPAPPSQAPAATAAPQPRSAVDQGTPTAATLGIVVYPDAQFVGSYDAGRGQRYYLFATTASFVDVVGYYRTQLDERGDLVYKEPLTHMFSGGSLGRFREETMAFPPSVTVKDWTSGGSLGFPNPKLGAQPARFPTIIMIVPAPPGTPTR